MFTKDFRLSMVTTLGLGIACGYEIESDRRRLRSIVPDLTEGVLVNIY